MSRYAFRYLNGSYGLKLLLAAIATCASTALTTRGDERPAKSAGASVAKAGAPQPAASSATAEKPTKERIQQLIQDLGSSHYTARRAAATELRQIGSDAFDLLDAATDNADPEVAASANYLLRQIPVRWVQADDHPLVRAQMRNYGQEPEARRLQHVDVLDRLSNGKGNAALCRIARYDRSLLIARTAALAIIRPDEKPSEQPHVEAEVFERELGASTRAPALWLRQYLAQIRDPASSVPVWKSLIEQESNRLNKNMGDTSSDILLGLSWNLADLYRQIGDQPALNGAMDRMIGLAAEGSDDTLVSLLAWLAENKSWTVLDTFLTKHQSRLEQSKRPLYYAALARAKQGKKDLAEELAVKASLVTSPEAPREGLAVAKELEERSQFDWAVREYRRTIEKQPAASVESILGRLWLANLLHDYEHEKEAAEALDPLVKTVLKAGGFGQLYAQTRENWKERVDIPTPEGLAARYHFYRACQYQNEKDLQRARDEYDLAIKFDSEDADVLIAMYLFPKSDAKWHDAALARVTKLVKKFEKEIEENPNDPSAYNQWAWLVSNTEGDFQQAIRYSHRSVELNKRGESGEASFLDTLGRCYYAAGDYENAVKYEREAVAKVDYLQVMQRQLALFEKALADKKAGATKQSAKTN
jgi:tetratricopeptide (TPR) repeat protein